MLATMGILTPRQRLLVKKMSHIVIHQDYSSTEQEPSSYDEESKPIEQKFLEKAVYNIAQSEDKTDIRFINLYRTSQAWRFGANFKDFQDLKDEERADTIDSLQQDATNDSQMQIVHNAASL